MWSDCPLMFRKPGPEQWLSIIAGRATKAGSAAIGKQLLIT